MNENNSLPGKMFTPYLREAQDLFALWSNRTPADFREHLATLADADLPDLFPLEHGSHARILADARKRRCKVAHVWKSFRVFLTGMGPIPNREWTLDRLDPANLLYGPGLCRWATKAEQANNRQNTVLLRGSNGRIAPLTEWAAQTRQAPATIRRRLDRGWKHEEAITGQRTAPAAPPAASPKAGDDRNPWPAGMNADRWQPAYAIFRSRFVREFDQLDRRLASRAVFALWALTRELERAERALDRAFPDRRNPNEAPPAGLARHPASIFIEDILPKLAASRSLAAPVPGALAFARTLSGPARTDLMAPVLHALGWGGWPAGGNADD